jgi:hypothetical protein
MRSAYVPTGSIGASRLFMACCFVASLGLMAQVHDDINSNDSGAGCQPEHRLTEGAYLNTLASELITNNMRLSCL